MDLYSAKVSDENQGASGTYT